MLVLTMFLLSHAIITFLLEGFLLDEGGITNTRIDFFNQQNVLSAASIKCLPSGYVLMLDGIFGVDASISCERMSVKLQPGNPSSSSTYEAAPLTHRLSAVTSDQPRPDRVPVNPSEEPSGQNNIQHCQPKPPSQTHSRKSPAGNNRPHPFKYIRGR